jgi:pyruvate/2-oxoglutarate dehydrogenase complex dihydrolipoamide dehydrogenase (E3) component
MSQPAAPLTEIPHADRQLLERVRPSAWRNPRPRDRYDLVVVGAGTGGLVSAAIASALGTRVALVERRRLGGDCLNFGCVPSKGILAAARSWAAARAGDTSRFGAQLTREQAPQRFRVQ